MAALCAEATGLVVVSSRSFLRGVTRSRVPELLTPPFGRSGSQSLTSTMRLRGRPPRRSDTGITSANTL
jgi:hypothetical protein